jgi:lipopolysaccharide/colanic/teichoic acid biosynthesis glycosyltransferase
VRRCRAGVRPAISGRRKRAERLRRTYPGPSGPELAWQRGRERSAAGPLRGVPFLPQSGVGLGNCCGFRSAVAELSQLWVQIRVKQRCLGNVSARGGKMLRRPILLSIDLLLVAFATVMAILLRGDIGEEIDFTYFIPFVSISIGVASIVFFVGGLDRTLWQYSSLVDYSRIVILSVLVVLTTFVLTFAVNRLHGIARSLPILQFSMIVAVLISTRSVTRTWFGRQRYQNLEAQVTTRPCETVLVAGVGAVSELFLRCVKEFASEQVRVAGILAEEPMLRGRTLQQKPILGTTEELPTVLASLEVHGVAIDRIVVATTADRLSAHALEILLEVEKTSDIIVQFLSERLGFEDAARTPLVFSERERAIIHRQQAPTSVPNVSSTRKSVWILKRIVDVFGAVSLMIMLAPVTVLVGLVVALDVGYPLVFWQQRPGLHGRPFKLFKFRTMAAPHDKHFRQVPDEQRLSAVGQFFRRTRLDELPQLYNVLIGDMSLVGPRPLLPCDQSPDYAARLLVRPGITGWAQVNGGRIVSPHDKAILDIWYVNRASFALDLKIMLRTLQIVLFGDRISTGAVDQARRELEQVPVLKALLWAETVSPAE